MKTPCLQLLLLATLLLPAAAQSTISPTANSAYSANAGWINFRPSDPAGVVVGDTCLAGKAWAANCGWIDFGDGSPANGHAYSNSSAADFGVNLAPDGALSGHAYSANTGWIVFEQTHGQPTLNYLTGQFSGHAWSANLGWIALDTPSSDLVTTSIARPDTDGDGIADAWERLNFAGSLTVATASTNADHDPASDREEYWAGSNPNDPASYLRILSHTFNTPPTEATIEFSSSPSRLYRLEHDSDLAAPWTDSGLGTFAPAAGTTTTKTIPLPSGPACFLRAVAKLPLEP